MHLAGLSVYFPAVTERRMSRHKQTASITIGVDVTGRSRYESGWETIIAEALVEQQQTSSTSTTPTSTTPSAP